jgi:hypothetical protein
MTRDTASSSRAERPRKDLNVFLYCDDDGCPVGVKFFESAPVLLLVEMIDTMLMGADGEPCG